MTVNEEATRSWTVVVWCLAVLSMIFYTNIPLWNRLKACLNNSKPLMEKRNAIFYCLPHKKVRWLYPWKLAKKYFIRQDFNSLSEYDRYVQKV